MSKEYPVEIYPKPNERIKDSAERIYDLGFRDGRFKERLEASNPLAGWSNLTAAIADGARIEWDALDGVEAKCVHAEQGTLTHKLERDAECPPEEHTGWYAENCPPVWPEAFYCSWLGRLGWSLWVKGDLPLRKLTADQLEPGTCFRALYQMGAGTYTYTRAQVIQIGDKTQVACFSGSTPPVIIWHDPADIEVLEVYGVGTFQTPKENA